MQPWLDHVKRELENAVFSPPDWVVDRLRTSLAEAIGKAIPKCFAESIHEIIEQSVEKSLSDAVLRGVSKVSKKRFARLVEELALLRQARCSKTWTTIGGRVTRTTNQTTNPTMTSPSDLSTAIAGAGYPRQSLRTNPRRAR